MYTFIPLLMFQCTRSFVSFCFKLIWIWYCIVLCLTCCSSHCYVISFYVVSYMLLLGLLRCIGSDIPLAFMFYVVLDLLLLGFLCSIRSAISPTFLLLNYYFVLYRICFSSNVCIILFCVLLNQLDIYVVFCSSIVINTVIVTAGTFEPYWKREVWRRKIWFNPPFL